MSITKKFATQQVARFWDAALHFLPQKADELVAALQDAPSEEIAAAAVSALIRDSTQCPTPSEVRGAVRSQRDANAYWEPPVAPQARCTRCQDEGVYGGALTGTYAGPWKWCGCRAGVEREGREPELIANANTARGRLLNLFGEIKKQVIAQQAEAYQGEF